MRGTSTGIHASIHLVVTLCQRLGLRFNVLMIPPALLAVKNVGTELRVLLLPLPLLLCPLYRLILWVPAVHIVALAEFGVSKNFVCAIQILHFDWRVTLDLVGVILFSHFLVRFLDCGRVCRLPNAQQIVEIGRACRHARQERHSENQGCCRNTSRQARPTRTRGDSRPARPRPALTSTLRRTLQRVLPAMACSQAVYRVTTPHQHESVRNMGWIV